MLGSVFKTLTFTFAVSVAGMGAYASQMTYTPVNPDFGGSPFNASGLLAEANANNHFQAPTTQTNAQQNFTNTITNAVLGEISTNIADKIFNSTSGQAGNIVVGTSEISYNNVGTGVNLTITDLTTGQSTSFSNVPTNSR